MCALFNILDNDHVIPSHVPAGTNTNVYQLAQQLKQHGANSNNNNISIG